MIGIIFIMAGLMLSAIDIPMFTLAVYPEYKTIHDDPQLGEVIQDYVVNNMLGDSLRIDVMSDLLGYLLMIIGAVMLIRYNKTFVKILLPIVITAVLYVLVKISPFLISTDKLVVFALAVSFIHLVLSIFTERKLVYTVGDTTSDLPNDRDIVLMKFGFIGAALCQAFLYFIVLVGLADGIIIAYMIARAGFMIFCVNRMFFCRHYIHKCYA
jgi:hypothetical protein